MLLHIILRGVLLGVQNIENAFFVLYEIGGKEAFEQIEMDAMQWQRKRFWVEIAHPIT